MEQIRSTLSQYPIRTRLSLSGTLIVARDIAHAKLQVLKYMESAAPEPTITTKKSPNFLSSYMVVKLTRFLRIPEPILSALHRQGQESPNFLQKI